MGIKSEVKSKKRPLVEVSKTKSNTEKDKKAKKKKFEKRANNVDSLIKSQRTSKPVLSPVKESLNEEIPMKNKKSSKIIRKPEKIKTKKATNKITHSKSDSLEKNEPETKKKIKYKYPTKVVTKEIVSKSLNILQQIHEKSHDNKKMFEEEPPIFLEIRSIKIQNGRANVKFLLPHSIVASTGEVCLITPDLKRGKKHDHEPSIDHWEELLKKEGVKKVKTILPMRQLRVEYDQYELKRRLMTQHDFILVDARILNHVSHILGKQFFQKHNMLVPVRLHQRDLKTNIENGLKTSILRLNIGATSTLTVGHMGMKMDEVAENVLAVVKQIKEKFPGGEANIRTLHLKLPLSLSLPIYITLRSKKTVAPPKLHHSIPNEHQVVEDELSTVPGSTVKVTPQGRVILKRAGKEYNDLNDVSDEDIEEELQENVDEPGEDNESD